MFCAERKSGYDEADRNINISSYTEGEYDEPFEGFYIIYSVVRIIG